MEIVKVYEELSELMKTKSVEEVCKFLQEKCVAYDKEKPDDYIGRSALYNELGAILRNTGHFEDGEKSFIIAKTLLERKISKYEESCSTGCCCGGSRAVIVDSFDKTSDGTIDLRITAEYGTILNNLAGLYRMSKQYDKSITLFNDALAVYKVSANVPVELLASCYNNLGILYIEIKELDNAISNLNTALEIVDGKDEETATTKGNLGIAYFAKEDYVNARLAMEQAAELRLKVSNKDDDAYKYYINSLETINQKLC